MKFHFENDKNFLIFAIHFSLNEAGMHPMKRIRKTMNLKQVEFTIHDDRS